MLDETMQQLAFLCSVASCRPVDAGKLPELVAKFFQKLSQLPAEHKQGVCDIARLVDGYLITKASSGSPAASKAEKKPHPLQLPPDSGFETDEEPPVQKALSIAPKPAKAHTKAAAPASKPTQPQPAAAAPSLASSLADTMRPTPAVVNDGDQRAATKRLQLRNKLKRAHEAAGSQSASQKAEAVASTLAEVQAIKADSNPPQDEQISSVPQPDADGLELPAVKPSRKTLKRERRRAAAAAAAETAASAGLQPDAADSLHDPSDGPSTAEGTSSSSAASLAGSEAGTPPARGQAVVAQQGLVADDNAGSSKEGSLAAQDHAASTSHLPAADSSISAATSPSGSPAQAGGMLSRTDAATESGPAQTSTKPDISTQTPDATTASPVVASAHQAAAPEADKEPQASSQQISSADPLTRSRAPPQASSAADTGRMTSADTATGSAAGRDARVQPPKPDFLSKQKAELRPSTATAVAAAAPLSPAAIAAHRPAVKVVLRASAAPYTPLSSKATLVDSTNPPATGAKPGLTASSSTKDKGKKQVPAGTCLCSATQNLMFLLVTRHVCGGHTIRSECRT